MHVNSHPFILQLTNAINNQQLPGKNAQKQMLPKGRLLQPENDTPARLSAVLIMVYRSANNWKLVMIQRAEYDGVHSGQIAFPGGKKEPDDKNLLHTALRESEEEIGVHHADIETIGKLSPLFIPVSNMCVHPYMGFMKNEPVFVKQDKEVQRVITIPLEKLLHKETQTNAVFQGANYQIEAPCYSINGYKIWGASAMILSEFISILKNIPDLAI